MSEDQLGARCRNTAGFVVRAFAGLLEEQAVDGQVSLEVIRRTCAAMGGADDLLADLYAHSERACLDVFAFRQVDGLRTNYVGRIVTKTFAHVLDDRASGLSRDHLGRLFTALRMILGEEGNDALQERCAEVARDLTRGPAGVIPWEDFYRHPEIARIREQVLVSVARTFRRFEMRKDWFLIVMNSSPNCRSIGGSAFVAAKPGKRSSDDFGEAKFLLLFEAMFASCAPKTLNDEQRAAFAERWQATPESVFGPLFVELARMRARLGHPA